MAHHITIALLGIGLPACALRLWWIWWKSICDSCGREHSVCTCPVPPETMRRRR